MMARVLRAPAVLAALALGACHFAPVRKGLCYMANGAAADYTLVDGVHRAQMLGAEVRIDLAPPHARIAVVVRNNGKEPLDVRLGGDGAVPETIAGELLLRPLDTAAVAERPDVVPLALWQTVRVKPGWSGSFFLDSALGREPSYGQTCNLVVEGRTPAGKAERKSLPLVVRYVASSPPSRAR